MNRIVIAALCLYYASGAAAMECNQERAGKNFCISGEMMRCAKTFSQETKDFAYRWDGVNSSGQSFDTRTHLFRKVPGFTPVACPASSPSAEKQPPSKSKG